MLLGLLKASVDGKNGRIGAKQTSMDFKSSASLFRAAMLWEFACQHSVSSVAGDPTGANQQNSLQAATSRYVWVVLCDCWRRSFGCREREREIDTWDHPVMLLRTLCCLPDSVINKPFISILY